MPHSFTASEICGWSPRRLSLARLAAIALGLGGLAACTPSRNQEPGEEKAVSAAAAADISAPPAASPIPRGIEPDMMRTGGHSYRRFSAAHTELAIRLDRPSPKDIRVLLSVAGTYTSPDDKVLGIVMLDGRLVEKGRMAWEGLLTIVGGTPHITKASKSSLSSSRLKGFASQGASLLQGHLLVHQGQPERYKPSPPLYRRALATFRNDTWAVVESVGPVELQPFARDLANLGASGALNLDMGGWSEGWFRDPSGSTKPLGVPHPSTGRQTNWLVILRKNAP